MKKATIPLAAAIIFAMSQFGTASAQMTRPQFGPKLEKLSFLLGSYKTESKITMGPNSSTGSGYTTARRGLDSMFVFISSRETNSSMGSYRSFGVLGYNSTTSEYVLTMFNIFGSRSEFKGNFSGDTLSLAATINTPRGTFKQRMDWFKEGENLRLLIYGDFGQGYTLMVDETATPVKGGKMMMKPN